MNKNSKKYIEIALEGNKCDLNYLWDAKSKDRYITLKESVREAKKNFTTELSYLFHM